MFNLIIDLEEIPTLKQGSICPVCKGDGRDPRHYNEFCVIVLENLVLSRFEPTLIETGFPHQNQSAFRKHVGCSDAIFATQELIARYISEGSTVHMCLFDLENAYDSVEFAILLDQLFSIGVNGKTWCLIRYENGRCCVKVDGRSSPTFPVERGVRQGSVLSPTLFNIVMDPLLRSMEAAGLGLCVITSMVVLTCMLMISELLLPLYPLYKPRPPKLQNLPSQDF